jgi:hypothetical protein
MTFLLVLLLAFPIMPPPWTPAQPVVLPLRVEATGGADVTIIPNDDGTVISVNIRPADGQPCWSVHVSDAAGQSYRVTSPAGSCGTTLYVPFVENAHADD